MIELETFTGFHIAAACKEAVELANAQAQDVRFVFNDTEVIAHPGDSVEQLESKWASDSEAAAKAYRESPEYIERQRKEAEEYQRKRTASMKETAQTEAELRETQDPWPYAQAQLVEYINSLVDRPHDYGTCVYAMSLAATAAFNYMAHQLGVTEFQSSCADLDFLRRSRGLKGPFMFLKAEDALYPQYDLPGKLAEAMEGWKPWLKEQAEKELAKNETAHPNVIAHWKELAGQ